MSRNDTRKEITLVTQHDFDPYALLDSLRAGGDIDLIRTSVEQSLETQKRVWENGRIEEYLHRPPFQPDRARTQIDGSRLVCWAPEA